MKKNAFMKELINSLTVLRNQSHPDRLIFTKDSLILSNNNAFFLFLTNIIMEGTPFQIEKWTPAILNFSIPLSKEEEIVHIKHCIPLIRNDNSNNNINFCSRIFPFIDLLIKSAQPNLLDPRWMRWFLDLSLEDVISIDHKHHNTRNFEQQQQQQTPFILKKYLNISVIDQSIMLKALPSIRANLSLLQHYSDKILFQIGVSGISFDDDVGDDDSSHMDYIYNSDGAKPIVKLGIKFERKEILEKINNVL